MMLASYERPAVDLDLETDPATERLRRYQPILAFDARELFFPLSVERYLERCTLWVEDEEVLRTPAASDLDHRWGPSSHLRFVDPEERREQFGREVTRTARRLVSPRLGLVGLFGRLIDAVFLVLVMLRPTTPKATAMAADRKARRHGMHARPACYGRAVRAGEWLVLHYSWLYAMNDWRSGYRGMNDHEGDWEQAWIFVDPADGRAQWVATSNHEQLGPDLRRHKTDPELTLHGDRPVLFAGAGSHAIFFQAGDYVTRFDLPGLRWLGWLQQLGRRLTGSTRAGEPGVGIPFVDFARGDGETIDDAELFTLDGMAWCEEFRGLWGVDTGDPLQAERGPSGPKFDRRGRVRVSWADPIGHAGLHGTVPPSALRGRVTLDKIDRTIDDLDEQVRASGRLLPLALQANPGRLDEPDARRLTELLRTRTELVGLRSRIATGHLPAAGVRDHLRRPLERLETPDGASGAVALWAMLSVPLLLGAFGVSLLVGRLPVLLTMAGALAGIAIVEQLLRRCMRSALRIALLAALLSLLVFVAVGPLLSVTHYVVGATMVSASLALVAVNGAEWFRARHRRSQGT